MTSSGTLSPRPGIHISDLPSPVLRVACGTCKRSWTFDRDERISHMGDLPVAQMLWRVTHTCPHKAMQDSPCGAKLIG